MVTIMVTFQKPRVDIFTFSSALLVCSQCSMSTANVPQITMRSGFNTRGKFPISNRLLKDGKVNSTFEAHFPLKDYNCNKDSYNCNSLVSILI